MLAYVLDAWAEAAGPAEETPPVVVYSPPTAALTEAFADRAAFALQEEPRGTGDAVRAALAAMPGDAAEIVVLSGDVPLVTGPDLAPCSRRGARTMPRSRWPASSPPIRHASAASCAASSGRWNASSRQRTPADDELEGNEVNAGLYAFDAAWLRRRIDALAPSPATGELYLTELVRVAREDGRIVSAITFEDDGRFDGINDRSQLAQPSGPARAPQRGAHARRRDDARPVDGLPRLGRRAGAGRRARTERDPARPTTVGQGTVIGSGAS